MRALSLPVSGAFHSSLMKKAGVKDYRDFAINLLSNIKDKVFVGSNSSLIAPVTINENSTIGAGSVITKNVKKKSLALTRSPQIEIKNYKRKK